MSHQETYKQNEAYAEFLQGWDPKFYAKYAESLMTGEKGARVLDVGCGVGQVVHRLKEAGYEAHGVDVSEPNIQRAKSVASNCQIYDGKRLPFESGFFSGVGALNVLEHVEEPEKFIVELVRVVNRGGKIVLSSPNFLRVLGYKDYHPKMRGIGSKWNNLRTIRAKRSLMKSNPDKVKFDRMEPIIREKFQPDDDAIIATNPLEMAFFLKRAGCLIESISCTDRHVPKLADLILNATPTRYLMFNAFLIARKE